MWANFVGFWMLDAIAWKLFDATDPMDCLQAWGGVLSITSSVAILLTSMLDPPHAIEKEAKQEAADVPTTSEQCYL